MTYRPLKIHPIPYQGSKRRLAPDILKLFPPAVHTLYEPFVGSAAVSLAAAHYNKAQCFHLNDSLGALMGIWRLVIDDPDALADAYECLWLAQGPDPREFFFRVRQKFNAKADPAALLFLLVRCVKNAVRFNSSGEFNQSPDNRRRGTRPKRMRQHIVAAHKLLQGHTTTSALDYAAALHQAGPQDLVYLDPPYQGTSGKRNKRYYEQLDLDRFVGELRCLRQRRVPCILSLDGRSGSKTYGRSLPTDLGLVRLEVCAGRSSQATLNGRTTLTYESLYLSPEVASQCL